MKTISLNMTQKKKLRLKNSSKINPWQLKEIIKTKVKMIRHTELITMTKILCKTTIGVMMTTKKIAMISSLVIPINCH